MTLTSVAALILTAFTSFNSSALSIEAPTQLLERASKSRTELRQVIFDINKNIKEFVDLEQLTAYAELVDQLEPLAQQYLLEEIYPGALSDLGSSFFGEASKWLDPRRVNAEQLQFYFRWANFDQAFRYSELVEFYMASEMSDAQLFTALSSVEQLRKMALDNLPEHPQLQLNFQRVLSDRAAKVILETEFEPRWLPFVTTASGFSLILDRLSEDLLGLDADKKMLLTEMLDWLTLLEKQMNLAQPELPSYLWSSLSLNSTDALLKSLELEQNLSSSQIDLVLVRLSASELRGFAQNLTGREQVPSREYFQTFLVIYQSVLKALNEQRLFETERWLNLQLQRLSAPVALTNQDGEGQYELVEVGSDKKWLFTLIKGVDDRVFVSIGSSSGQVFKSFFYTGYDATSREFTAVEREADIDFRPNPSIRFYWDDLGELQVVDHHGSLGFLAFKGRKIQQFPAYPIFDPGLSFSPERYEGEIEYLGGIKRPVALVINQVNQQLFGRLTIFNRRGQPQNFVDYQFGKLVSNQLVSLTSGLLPSKSLNHLRGRIEQDQFRGVMIVGGRGLATNEFVLKRRDRGDK